MENINDNIMIIMNRAEQSAVQKVTFTVMQPLKQGKGNTNTISQYDIQYLRRYLVSYYHINIISIYCPALLSIYRVISKIRIYLLFIEMAYQHIIFL